MTTPIPIRGALAVATLAALLGAMGACTEAGSSIDPAAVRPGTDANAAVDAPPDPPDTPFPLDGPPYAHTTPQDMSPTVAGVPTRVYVPNSESNTVDVIDPATFKVIDHHSVGKVPQHVTPSWNLRHLFVNNNGSNSLTPIDPKTGRPGRPIPVSDPYNLYFTPDGSRAIVVAERLKRLDIRDPHTFAPIASIPISHSGVDHLDFSADGSYLLVSAEFSGWVVRVDLNKRAVTGEVKVGGSPIDVKLSPDGSVFFVANQTRNGVSVIDPARMTETSFIPTAKGAHGLYYSRDLKSLYVSNRGDGSVSVIDVASRTVRTIWRFGGTPDMGGVSADGSQLWLAGRYSAAVYVIDTRDGRLLARIRVGNGPHGLCLFPQPGRFSLGHTGVYR
jgi:YVTN family beta-propeller protein